ncbi:MAG: hypothetical protein K2I04_00895, partial [Muribaculaceae bacterium]|nr:hypothetical protein [Muribaculaceae bacterium]
MKRFLSFFFALAVILMPSYVSAQKTPVTGTVLDETSLPLIGARVNVADAKPAIGTITDIDGTFALPLPSADGT